MNALIKTEWKDLLSNVRFEFNQDNEEYTRNLCLLVDKNTGDIHKVTSRMSFQEGCTNINILLKTPKEGKHTVELADTMSLLTKEAQENCQNLIAEFNSRY